MNKEINLLPSKDRKLDREKKILSILWIFASLSLLIVFASSIILFFLKLNSPLLTLRKKEADILVQISQFGSKEVQFNYLSDRLINIKSIIEKRYSFNEIIEDIIKIVPEDVSADSISLSRGHFSVIFSTKSLLAADKLLNNAIDMTEKKKVFKKVGISGITTNPKTGEYNFSLDADL